MKNIISMMITRLLLASGLMAIGAAGGLYAGHQLWNTPAPPATGTGINLTINDTARLADDLLVDITVSNNSSRSIQPMVEDFYLTGGGDRYDPALTVESIADTTNPINPGTARTIRLKYQTEASGLMLHYQDAAIPVP